MGNLRWQVPLLFVFSFLLLGGCAKNKEENSLNAASINSEKALSELGAEIAKLRAELNRRQAGKPVPDSVLVVSPTDRSTQPNSGVSNESSTSCGMDGQQSSVVISGNTEIDTLRRRINELEKKLNAKRVANTISSANTNLLANEMDGHTNLYSLKGEYRVLVIPVQFSDAKFSDLDFIQNKAQDYLFGSEAGSLSSFYAHSSLGKMKITGEVASAITVDGKLADYGEAVSGATDKAARELVVQALLKLKQIKTDDLWWESFDNWDLNDYDFDTNRHEPDGFIDAVVLIYAGKPQSSCQASFDTDRTRPASAEVPPGPRHDATVECFNRIWPHRWSIALAQDDPRYSAKGPMVEGIQRPSMNGLKITEQLFALDYNMQSEFSDRATFIHEFGHSLTLPDIYDGGGPGNSTGEWEVMSGTSHLQAQEMSSYSKLSLGWLEPKIIRKGQAATAYVGAYNLVSDVQRENNQDYQGPEKVLEAFNGEAHSYDIVSMTPGYDEPVYRSVVALMGPTKGEIKVVDTIPEAGTYSAYSGRFDGNSKSIKLKIKVPTQGDAVLSFDEIHSIETETNFDSQDPTIKVVTDYDIGQIVINGDVKESLRLVSGDANFDSLAEANPACEASEVLAMRMKNISGQLSESEQKVFKEKLAICRKPVWVKRLHDLSALRGQDVEVEIRYTTDGGYTEFGIVVDNFTLGNEKVDFESGNVHLAGEFALLKNGKTEIQFNQFYLFEYRTPGEEYKDSHGNNLSYNMDNHINPGTQGMFQQEGNSLLERFRLFTIDYQPGVLVWYYNSKFDRRTNSPTLNGGKGYLLVLNSKVQEMPFPGVMGTANLFNANGEYDVDKQEFKDFVSEQARLFKCFGAIQYYTYIDGEAPNCSNIPADMMNKMKSLKFDSMNLVERREGFNEYLPQVQYGMFGVGLPMRNYATMRTALSTFRPATEPAANPIKVYKEVNGEMQLDAILTNSAKKYAPVDKFKDADNTLPINPRFHGDSVVVEKKGFSFRVVAPAARVSGLYSQSVGVDANDNYYRRPRAKLIFEWE